MCKCDTKLCSILSNMKSTERLSSKTFINIRRCQNLDSKILKFARDINFYGFYCS